MFLFTNIKGIPIRYLWNFIESISEKIKYLSDDMCLFVVVPPYHSYHTEQLFSATDLKQIIDYVDGLSLMTYDYSVDPNGGPNSPIQWIADNSRLYLLKIKSLDWILKEFIDLKY